MYFEGVGGLDVLEDTLDTFFSLDSCSPANLPKAEGCKSVQGVLNLGLQAYSRYPYDAKHYANDKKKQAQVLLYFPGNFIIA